MSGLCKAVMSARGGSGHGTEGDSLERSGTETAWGSGATGLGEFPLAPGLASLARIDPVRLATPVLADLCGRVEETVALAAWGHHGATCVRWVEAGGPITVTLRTGVVPPLTTSATGLAFAAFYRSPHMKKQLDAELKTTADSTGRL